MLFVCSGLGTSGDWKSLVTFQPSVQRLRGSSFPSQSVKKRNHTYKVKHLHLYLTNSSSCFRMTYHGALAVTVQAWALKVLCPAKPLSAEEIWTVGYLIWPRNISWIPLLKPPPLSSSSKRNRWLLILHVRVLAKFMRIGLRIVVIPGLLAV